MRFDFSYLQRVFLKVQAALRVLISLYDPCDKPYLQTVGGLPSLEVVYLEDNELTDIPPFSGGWVPYKLSMLPGTSIYAHLSLLGLQYFLKNCQWKCLQTGMLEHLGSLTRLCAL